MVWLAEPAGCHFRHDELIEHALALAETPSILKPTSLCFSDGNRPDGLTIVTWASGRSLSRHTGFKQSQQLPWVLVQ